MRQTVRALHAFLAVWLTATAALPPCCWSMAYAHEHEQTPEIAQTDATSADHHHDHHGSDDSHVGSTLPALSSIPAHDCNAEFADAATTIGINKRAIARPAAESVVDVVVPAVSAHDGPRSDTSPPGSAFISAFLIPLRI